jgi:hypothetical protein
LKQASLISLAPRLVPHVLGNASTILDSKNAVLGEKMRKQGNQSAAEK